MDFEKICTIFSMQEPYYGILITAMDRFQTDKVETLGVRRSGNVFCLGYNPNFIADKDLDTMMALLKHEALHIALNHLTLFEKEPENDAEHRLRNLAMDLEANCYIDFSRTNGIHPFLPADFNWEPCAGAIEYNNRLLQMNQQQQAQAKNQMMPCNGGKGGKQNKQQSVQTGNNQGSQSCSNGNTSKSNGRSGKNSNNPSQQNGQSQEEDDDPNNGNQSQQNQPQLSQDLQNKCDQSFDDHSMWPDELDENAMEDLRQAIDDLCVFAAEEVEKGRGEIPGEMKGRIDSIREKRKPKPVANWKKYFRRYIGNEFSDQIKKSRKRESFRFPDAAGNRHKRKSHILVGIDTSGSVSMPEYREFCGQMKTMKDVTFHVVECDARIQYEYDFNGKIHETLHGGGGTSFQPVIDMYWANRRKYEGVVYFTDGYCDIPYNTPKETLWVVSSRGDHNRQKYLKNGASAVFIPKQENNG